MFPTFDGINLNSDSEVPTYKQIENRILFEIASGRLVPKDCWPTKNTLGKRRRLGRNTVLVAYRRL